MAKTGSITITQGTQEIANNRTYITVTGKITTTGESYRGNSRTGTYTIKQGDKVIKSETFTHGAPANSTTTLFAVSLWVTHDSSGNSGTISVSYNYDNGWCTGSASTILTTIPRKSSISGSSGELGVSLPLTVTRKSTAFTHTVTWKCGSASGTICTKSTNTSLYFDTSNGNIVDLASQNATGQEVTVTFTIETFNGSTSIGSDSSTVIKLVIPDSVKPTATVTLLDAEGHLDKYGKYVQGQSKLQVSIQAEGVYGSTIKSYRTTFDGKTFTEAEFVTDAITGKDKLELEVVVTDSRGRSCTVTESIEVYEYNRPKITSIKAKRCQQHNVNLIGDEYLGVLFSAAVTPLDNQNTVKYELDYKKTTEDTYTTLSLDDYTNQFSVDGNTIFAADDDAYNIILRITDDFGPVEKKVNGPSVSVLVSKLRYNLGLAFGKLAELSGVLDIGFKTRFFGGILYMTLEDGTKADEVLTPNRYLVKSQYTCEGFPESEVDAVLDVVGDDEIIKQTFSVINKTKPRTYERVYTYEDESWSSWICLCGDFIIEQGVSGIWTYEKWVSGKAVCWGKYSAGSYSSGTSTWNNLYFSTIAMVDFPANLFISAPVLNWSASAKNFNGSFYKDSYITATKTGAWGLSKPTAFTDIVVYIDIEAKGRWKE